MNTNQQIITNIGNLASSAIGKKYFPGCAVSFFKSGERHDLAFGRHTYDANSQKVTVNSLYDVASITKSIPTSCLALKLIEDGKLSLDDPAANYLPELKYPEILIRHLLTYTVVFNLPNLANFKDKNADEILDLIYKAPLLYPVGEKYHYTNAPAILLGLIIQKISQKPLDKLADDVFFHPLDMHHTTFHPENFSKDQIAPTEEDAWRHRLLHGEIHDESSYILSQKYTVGSAGLFSTASDLLTFLQMLLSNGDFQLHQYLKPETIKQIYTNQIGHLNLSTGLGWELNQPHQGQYSGPHTFGKTGFTGCFITADPDKNVALTILSNAVHPHRPPDNASKNEFRRSLCDIVFAA